MLLICSAPCGWGLQYQRQNLYRSTATTALTYIIGLPANKSLQYPLKRINTFSLWADRLSLAQSSLLRGRTGNGPTPFSPFHIWLSIDYFWVVKCWGVSSPRFLGGFRGCGLVLAVWTPLREVVLVWLTSRWGKIAARILRGGYADAQVM